MSNKYRLKRIHKKKKFKKNQKIGLNELQIKAFEKVTEQKWKEEYLSTESITDKEQFVYFLNYKRQKNKYGKFLNIKINVYHRMGVDTYYKINRKGEIKQY